MKFLIRETSEVKELTLTAPSTGICWIGDFIGNTGATADETQFTWCEDREIYVCSLETFRWWESVVDRQQALDDRIFTLKEEFGCEKVINAIGNAGDCDLEYQASSINEALDEVFI